MLEHDYDTDEDGEVYFLKPVNEYNIVDKIKEANKELFNEADAMGADTPAEQKRKVKFRTNLEDYEPNPIDENENDTMNQNSSTGTVESEVLSINEDIEECLPPSASTVEECAEQLAMEVQKKIEAIEIQIQASDDEIEEICEEILEMDMENNQKPELVDATDIKPPTNSANKKSNEENSDDNEVLEEDEDDKLSIIVASYLPRDPPACDESRLTPKTYSFKRHFSFRRKTSGRRPHTRSPEITNLKLNYKTCCEHRNAEPIKLPKYTGYMSEYGLSRDQLEQRNQSAHMKHHVVVEKNLKASEAKIRKMQDNERAFTTWLKNKMRFPINRTKNMFDIKKSSNSCGNGRNGIFRSNQ